MHIRINYKDFWNFSSAGNFWFWIHSDQNFCHFYVLKTEKRLSLSAIISIIEKDNRLLDGIFGKPKRLYVTNVSSDLSSDADFRL